MFKMTLNRVHDTVKITEGSESLILRVDADPKRIVLDLKQADTQMKEALAANDEEAAEKAGRRLAAVIFGEDQAKRLIDFYAGDARCAVSLAARYFEERLAGLITRAQKRK